MSNRIRSAPLTSDRAFAAGEAAISNNTSETAQAVAPSVLAHGARVLPNVTIDTYNEELRDEDGFVGDRASGRAFRAILEDWRSKLRAQGADPFGDTPTHDISKSKLDKILAGADRSQAHPSGPKGHGWPSLKAV